MKHILPILTAALALMATVASAGTVYDVIETPYTNEYNEGTNGSYYKIRMKESGKLWITDFFNNTGSGTQSELLTSPTYGLTEYGYKDSSGEHSWSLTDDTRISAGDSYKYNLYKGENADVMTRNQYYLGEFAKDAEIEIYLTNGINSVASNTPAGYHLSTFNKRTDALNSAMDVGQLFLQGSAQINFGIVGVASEGSGINEGGAPVGSPLPGGLQIALIAGLFGLGFWYIRRRKSVVA